MTKPQRTHTAQGIDMYTAQDIEKAFEWIRQQLFENGCAATHREAGQIECQLDDVEIDVMAYLNTLNLKTLHTLSTD